MTEQLSIQQRARLFPCRREHGGCGAGVGEFCVNRRGRKSYTAHLDRLKQENDAWHQAHNQPERAARDVTEPARRLTPRHGTWDDGALKS